MHCLDAKINIDGNALYRQKRLAAMHDPSARKTSAKRMRAKFELNYVALDGNIGCMVNGAGLAMGTMDLVKTARRRAGQFPRRRRRRDARRRVAEAFKIILSDTTSKRC